MHCQRYVVTLQISLSALKYSSRFLYFGQALLKNLKALRYACARSVKPAAAMKYLPADHETADSSRNRHVRRSIPAADIVP